MLTFRDITCTLFMGSLTQLFSSWPRSSNTKDRVSQHFQALRRKLKIQRAAWCLQVLWNTILGVWYAFSMVMISFVLKTWWIINEFEKHLLEKNCVSVTCFYCCFLCFAGKSNPGIFQGLKKVSWFPMSMLIKLYFLFKLCYCAADTLEGKLEFFHILLSTIIQQNTQPYYSQTKWSVPLKIALMNWLVETWTR